MMSFLRRTLASLFSPQHSSIDPFVQMFDSALTMAMDTQSFLNQYLKMILLSNRIPDHTISRFMVQSVTLNKHTSSTSQHEYLTFEISDTCQEVPNTYLLFFEREPSDIQLDTSYFTNHPDSRKVLDAIFGHLVAPSSSTLPPNPNESHEYFPLLDTSSPSPSTCSRVATHQFFNTVLKPTMVPPNNQFLVGKHARVTHRNGHIIRQLQPHGLTLFRLIVLANTVHNHDPLYSLLKCQCYWFANTIYHVISNTYSCTDIITGGEPRNEMIEEVRIPPNDYLPDLAGRWMDVRVSNVSNTLIRLVEEKFESDYDEELAKVCFHTNFIKST
jgi:hypothetical protein